MCPAVEELAAENRGHARSSSSSGCCGQAGLGNKPYRCTKSMECIGLNQNFIQQQQPTEHFNTFKGRIKNFVINNYLTKGISWFYAELNFNGAVKSWDLGTGCHTTLYQLNAPNQSWRIDTQRDAAITAILGFGMGSLHATLEEHGQNNDANPKIYLSGTILKAGHLTPDERTMMQNKLNARAQNIRNTINHQCNTITNRLLGGWEVA
jgi:hypothetical protein